jgi:predicted transcriptional regulator
MTRINLDGQQIRQLYSCLSLGVSQTEIAARFAISQSKVSDLKHGRNIRKDYREVYLNYQKTTAILKKN